MDGTRFVILLIVIGLAILATPAFPEEAEQKSAEERNSGFSEEAFQEFLKKQPPPCTAWCWFQQIEKFDNILVTVEGSARKIGVNEGDFKDFVKLKFKNNFVGIPYEPFELGKMEGEEKRAYLWCRIWTASETTPLAIYVACEAGPRTKTFRGIEWEREALGIIEKDDVSSQARQLISRFIEELAADFFKERGEL